MSLTDTIIAHYGGDRTGPGMGNVSGPGHSRRDRSLSIRDGGPDGVLIYSHANRADELAFKRVLREDRFLPPLPGRGRDWTSPRPVSGDATAQLDDAERSAAALRLWAQSVDPVGTLVTTYLASRGVAIPPEDVECFRFHPACPFGKGERYPCMVALMRDCVTDAPVAIHRTALTADGRKIDRKMMGPARGAAVKLSGEVTHYLGIAEGIETALSIVGAGWRNIWAMGSSGGIAAMPLLPYITPTIFADADDAGQTAALALAQRYAADGRNAYIQTPRQGDFNDVVGGAHA